MSLASTSVEEKAAYKRAVMAEIDRRKDEAIELLRDLIKIPSPNPPGDEKAIADFCAAYLRAMDFEVEQIEPFERRVSNLGRRKGSTGTPALLFNSHLDTFNPGDLANYRYPPYAAEIHDDIIWGLGSKNMKAGLAAAMFAARALHDAGVKLRGDLLLSQTADEMQGGNKGLRQLVERNMIKADFAVYTESDPPVKIEISHRGWLWIDITVRGLGKHTKLKGKETPEGVPINAIAKMTKVIEAIEALEFTGWEPDPYIPGPPVISVNRIWGGQAENMIADNCTIRCDCRYLPAQTPEQIMADVERALDKLRAADPQLKVSASIADIAPPSVVSPDHPIVLALKSAIQEVTGIDMPVGGVSSTSDARWLVNIGIPTPKFEFQNSESGPGEHMAIDDYLNTIRVYATLTVDLLA